MRHILIGLVLAWCIWRVMQNLRSCKFQADDGIVWNTTIENRIKKSRARRLASSSTTEVKSMTSNMLSTSEDNR